jgi:hypothetical protein
MEDDDDAGTRPRDDPLTMIDHIMQCINQMMIMTNDSDAHTTDLACPPWVMEKLMVKVVRAILRKSPLECR